MITSTKQLVPDSNLLYRWETRHKLVGLMALIFSYAFIRELLLLPLVLAITVAVYSCAELSFSYYWSRIRLPGIFLLTLALILPFGAGNTVLAQLGPLALKLEGLQSVLLISVKLFSIFALVLILFAGTPLVKMINALRKLGLPSLLTEMIIFTNRYIYQLAGDLRRTQVAAGLRGFRGRSLFSLKTLAYMVGTLLVRSHDQSERVFQAMTLRGYGQEQLAVSVDQPKSGDRLALAGFLLLALSLILLQLLLFRVS